MVGDLYCEKVRTLSTNWNLKFQRGKTEGPYPRVEMAFGFFPPGLLFFVLISLYFPAPLPRQQLGAESQETEWRGEWGVQSSLGGRQCGENAHELAGARLRLLHFTGERPRAPRTLRPLPRLQDGGIVLQFWSQTQIQIQILAPSLQTGWPLASHSTAPSLTHTLSGEAIIRIGKKKDVVLPSPTKNLPIAGAQQALLVLRSPRCAVSTTTAILSL